MVTSVGMLAMWVRGGKAGRSSVSEAVDGEVDGVGDGALTGAGCDCCA